MKLKQSSNRVRIIVNHEAEKHVFVSSHHVSPSTTDPPSSSYAADEISTESCLCQAQRSSMTLLLLIYNIPHEEIRAHKLRIVAILSRFYEMKPKVARRNCSKVNWSSGHQRTIVVAPLEKATEASMESGSCVSSPSNSASFCLLLRQDELQNFGREERSG
uniref:Uncharacterized protein n=1 Tax=Salix viminalis TaxID=40686 RepID=A0A6N2NHZ8_SALVM